MLKRPVRPSCLALVLACVVSCSGEPKAPPGPAAEFPARRHDFGKVVQGTRVEHAFEVRNAGSADLVLDKVEASKVLKIERFDRVVPAGGRGEIRVALDTAGLLGVGKLAIQVYTNDPAASATVLGVDTQVVRPLEVEPRDRFYFFKVRGEGGEERLTLVNRSGKPVQVTGVASDNPRFRADFRPLAPGERWELRVTLDPATPAGRYEATVVVSTDSPAQPRVEVPVRAIVQEVVSAQPEEVYFGLIRASDLNRKEVSERQVLVTRHRGTGFELTRAETDLPFLKLATAPQKPGESWLLTVSIDPAQAPRGEIKGSVTVRTNDSAFPKIVLPVCGKIL